MGIKPWAQNPQTAENQHTPKDGERAFTQMRAQIQGDDGHDLAQAVNAWAELPAGFTAAIPVIAKSGENEGR
jgi:hypothetical protein